MSAKDAPLCRKQCGTHGTVGKDDEVFPTPGEQGWAGCECCSSRLPLTATSKRKERCQLLSVTLQLNPRKKAGAVTPSSTQVPTSREVLWSRKETVFQKFIFSFSYGSAYMFVVCQAGVMVSKMPESSYSLCTEFRWEEVVTLPLSELLRNPCD